VKNKKHIKHGLAFITAGIFLVGIGIYLALASNISSISAEVNRLAGLIDGQTSSSDSILTAATPPPNSTKPKITGVMDRKDVPSLEFATFNGKPLVTNFVVNANWSDIETSEGVYNLPASKAK